MKIGIGSDHAGYTLKTAVAEYLTEQGYEVEDFGTYSEASMDYPDVAHPVAAAVDHQKLHRAVLICGSGEGVCMTANKYAGVRAALVWNPEIAVLARQHNDANVLCLPGRFISESDARKAVDAFLNTEFEGGRHSRRVQKMSQTLSD